MSEVQVLKGLFYFWKFKGFSCHSIAATFVQNFKVRQFPLLFSQRGNELKFFPATFLDASIEGVEEVVIPFVFALSHDPALFQKVVLHPGPFDLLFFQVQPNIFAESTRVVVFTGFAIPEGLQNRVGRHDPFRNTDFTFFSSTTQLGQESHNEFVVFSLTCT